MPARRIRLRSCRYSESACRANAIHPAEKGITWAELAEGASLRKTADDKSKKPPPVPVEDEDYEDGDIATPKRDRHGNDDEPL